MSRPAGQVIAPDIMDPPDIEAEGDIKDALGQWILYCMREWERNGTQDEELFDEFQLDFDGWTKETFLRAYSSHNKNLRTFLRSWGVVVGTSKDIPGELAQTNALKEPLEWDRKEFTKQAKYERLYSRELQRLSKAAATPEPHQQSPATPQQQSGSGQ